MTKEEQDKSWISLSKEARQYIREEYDKTLSLPRKEQYELGVLHTFENIFGFHNLTSNVEPEEMLMVNRNFIIDYYKAVKSKKWYYEDGSLVRMMEQQEGKIIAMKHIFGENKCTPDECIHPDGHNCKWRNICDYKQCYFDPINQPKFNIGDKVIAVNEYVKADYPDVMVINRYEETGNGYVYYMEGMGNIGFHETNLKLYKEHETHIPIYHIGQKVKVIAYDMGMSSLIYYLGKICTIIKIKENGMYKLELVDDRDKAHYVNDFDRADEFLMAIQWDENFLEPYNELNVGDKVIDKNTKHIGIIKERYAHDKGHRVYFDDGDGDWDEELSPEDIELVDSEDNSNIEEQISTNFHIEDKIIIIGNSDDNNHIIGNIVHITYDGKYIIADENNIIHLQEYSADDLKLYSVYLKEHKLNLFDFINVDEKVFSCIHGDCIVDEIKYDTKRITLKYEFGMFKTYFDVTPNGVLYNTNGIPFIYPTEELYKKYPFDVLAAWNEWKNNKKE